DHQITALWVAYRHGRPVGRVAACIDSSFNAYHDVRWGWVGFYDTWDDPAVAEALFDKACAWTAARGAEVAVGPADFTTNDEIGLMVEGFDELPAVLTLQNPRYYERLWVDAGWEPLMDLWGWRFERNTTALSERQRRTLERLRQRANFRVRSIRMDDWDAEVGRFFDVYNAAWSQNWGFAPMPEAEIRHLGKQLKQIINPQWAFGIERDDGEVLAVCLALPDVNRLMVRVRSGRLLPWGWWPLLTGRKKLDHARVWALGIKPGAQHLALGPLLYQEIVDRLAADPYMQTAEASWMLATNHRINDQIEAMGAVRTKTWRLYQRPLTATGTASEEA
ncbi:MAG: GNAT family N-acetyltransferase, partial [Actinomycetota bacterium]|nr:GNAT family N-acetyltransferase [Actinomycetota bacterium]